MASMKVWQYSSVGGGLEKNLAITEIPRPTKPGEQELIVQVISTAVNPADYKVPELGLVAKAVIRTPATPGTDFVGRVVAAGSKVDTFRIGETVYGKRDYTQHGTLGEYITVSTDACVSVPEGADLDQLAAIGTAGLSAYQPLVTNVKAGDKVFLNGGAGGTGTFGIQIAKLLGCHVTTTCSGPKVGLCKELGADEAIDYTTTNVSQKLKESGQVFKLVVDFVGSPADLYKAADDFLVPGGKFIQVGVALGFTGFKLMASRMLLPGFLGGGHNKFEFYSTKIKNEDLAQLGKWMAEGKLKTVVDEVFQFEDAPKAFEKLKTGRTTGKIIIHVSEK